MSPNPSGKSGDRRVCVGIVGAPHGVRGEVRIKSETADPLDIASYGPLATEDGRTLEIATVRPAKGVVVARFEGVNDRDAAEALKNRRLFVDRDALPEKVWRECFACPKKDQCDEIAMTRDIRNLTPRSEPAT